MKVEITEIRCEHIWMHENGDKWPGQSIVTFKAKINGVEFIGHTDADKEFSDALEAVKIRVIKELTKE